MIDIVFVPVVVRLSSLLSSRLSSSSSSFSSGSSSFSAFSSGGVSSSPSFISKRRTTLSKVFLGLLVDLGRYAVLSLRSGVFSNLRESISACIFFIVSISCLFMSASLSGCDNFGRELSVVIVKSTRYLAHFPQTAPN